MHPCIHASMTCIDASMHPCVNASMFPCIHASMRPCIHAFMNSFIHSFIHSFVRSFVLSFVRWFVPNHFQFISFHFILFIHFIHFILFIHFIHFIHFIQFIHFIHFICSFIRSFVHSCIPFHYILLHFITFHFMPFHFIPCHVFISFHFIFISSSLFSFHFISFSFHFHFISFHYVLFHFTSLHVMSCHFIDSFLPSFLPSFIHSASQPAQFMFPCFSSYLLSVFAEAQAVTNGWMYFLGLRPLAGYASLKLYHVMSCFCMRNVSCAMIWLVRLCMLPTPTPDDAGHASFLGPSRAPTQKADMGSRARARAPEAAETAAQKEQLASQPGNANATKHCK